MNCPNCNATLVPGARFCPVCGMLLPDTAGPVLPGPPVSISEAPTLQQMPPPGQWTPPPVAAQQPAPWSARPQPLPPPQFAPQQPPPQRTFSQAETIPASPALRNRTRGKGCLLQSVIGLVLLLAVLTGAWFFALRPALHSLAENQIGEVLSSGMGEINPIATALVPAGIPLPVPESLISGALVMPTSSWFTIQNMQLNITPQAINVSFQVKVALFTFSCTVTTVPQVVNGQAENQHADDKRAYFTRYIV